MVPPLVLGHEFAGEVVAVGPGVSDDLKGRRVTVDPVIACDACPACLGGGRNICNAYRVLGCREELPGALAEMVVVDVDRTFDLPDGCSYLSGSLIQPLAVSHHAVVDRAGVVPGDDVLILGAGPVGLGALMLSRAEGASTTVVDIDPYRLALARRMGADLTLTAEEAAEWNTRDSGPRVVLECAGGTQTSTLRTATDWCRPGGTIVIVGNFAEGFEGLDPVAIKVKELDILGSQAYADSFGPLIGMVGSGRIDPLEMVSHVVDPDAPWAAFELLDDPEVNTGKVVLSAHHHSKS